MIDTSVRIKLRADAHADSVLKEVLAEKAMVGVGGVVTEADVFDLVRRKIADTFVLAYAAGAEDAMSRTARGRR